MEKQSQDPAQKGLKTFGYIWQAENWKTYLAAAYN